MVGASENSSSTEIVDNGDAKVPVIKELLPTGDYTLVGVDIDTTGRRLIDEIVQLAAYTPNDHFEQYIMPYMNLNPAARQRHQVRVISIGFYRMLKSMQTYKIIKSKSEIAALKDFLDWLEAVKAKNANSQGIILIYHEERKFIPYMVLESLKKYGLLDRFANTVKSFANSLNLAKSNLTESLKHYSLRKLSKYLMQAEENNNNNNSNNNVVNNNNINNQNDSSDNKSSPQKVAKTGYQYDRDQFDGNASVRAKLAYNVALQLSNKDPKNSFESIEALNSLFNALKPFAIPIHNDIDELDTQNVNLERQNSFRPVFLNYFKTTLYHRVRAVKFRIILAEHGFDLQGLNSIWSEKGSAGLSEALQVMQNLKNDDKTELVDLLDSYFDPNKSTIKPVVKSNSNRRRNRRGVRNNKNDGSGSARSVNTEYGAGGDKSQSVPSVPDSTTKSPSPQKTANVVGGGRPQRKRNPRQNFTNNNNNNNNNNMLKAPNNNQTVATGQVNHATIPAVPIAATN